MERIPPSARLEAQIDELLSDYLHVFPAGMAPMRDAVMSEWKARFGHDGKFVHYHSPGCAQCEKTGYRGRLGLHELLVVSRDMRRLIQTGGRIEQIQHTALQEGMRTLRQDGIEKVLMGATTIEEVRATSNV